MKQIEIHLYGNPEILADGVRVNFPYKKAEGFLYYLCVKKSVSRDEITCLLWGDEDETAGKKKLRDAIYQVRRFLDKDVLLTAGHSSISLNPAYPISIDYDQTADGRGEAPGIFLHHFYIKNCYEFEEWADGIRQAQSQAACKSAREQLNQARESHDLQEIQRCGELLIQNDPYNEDLYYELMNLYAENGNCTMAIRLYHDLEKLLAEEMDVEPSPRLTDLFHRVFNVKEHVINETAPADTPFVGRKKELYDLSGLLDPAPGSLISCLAVEGEEGVGKTAFMECGLKMAAGRRMLPFYAICYRQGTDFFLRPWNDIFQEMKQRVENGVLSSQLAPVIEKTLTQLLNQNMDEASEARPMRYQAIEKLVLELFSAITKVYRVMLVFDDIQWMDSMSFQLLNRLLLTTDPARLVMLCAYHRGTEISVMKSLNPLMQRDRIRILTLQPFTREETNELLHRVLPQLDGETDKRDKIYETTDGNAFFLKEMINIIREKGYTLEKSMKTNLVIRDRLSQVTPEEKEVLSAMSIFPEKIRIEELELLMQGMDRLSLLKILEQLQDNFLIKEVLVGWNVYYKFVHRMFQEYIYEHQSAGRRQLYHRMLAGYYEKQAQQHPSLLPLVAYHYERCHDEVKSYHYRIQYLEDFFTVINENFPVLHSDISDLGDDIGTMTEAEKMLELAEDVIRMKGDTPEIRQMKMEMHYIKGRFDIAVGEYDTGIANIEMCIRLAQRSNSHKTLLACYKQQIFHGIQREDLEKVEQYVTLGLGCTGREEPDEYATFLRLKGWYHAHHQEYGLARETLEQALRLFQDLEEGDGKYLASIAACYKYLGDIYRDQNLYGDALTCYKKAASAGHGPVETNGMAQIQTSIGQVLYYQERFGEALIHLERARDTLEKSGYRWGLDRAEALLALTCIRLERLGEAALHLEKGRALAEKIQNPTTEKMLETAERLLRK